MKIEELKDKIAEVVKPLTEKPKQIIIERGYSIENDKLAIVVFYGDKPDVISIYMYSNIEEITVGNILSKLRKEVEKKVELEESIEISELEL